MLLDAFKRGANLRRARSRRRRGRTGANHAHIIQIPAVDRIFHAEMACRAMLRAMRTAALGLRFSRALLLAGLVSSLLIGGRAHAGVIMVSQRGAHSPTTMYLDGDKLRVDTTEEHVTSIIMDAAGKRMLMVNDKDKSYMEFTEADAKRMKAKVEEMRAQMQERMKNMPPAQRKQMEGMMAGMGPGGAAMTGGAPPKPVEYKFERAGGKKTINGFSCEMYKVLADGKLAEEDCISPWSAGLVKKEDFAGLRKFGEEWAKDFGGMTGRGGGGEFDKFEKFPGIPISRVPLKDDGKPGEEEQIKSVKRESIPAAKFVVPAGYTKKESPMEGGMGGPGGRGPGGHGRGPGGHRPPMGGPTP
jgi:hypothetical protein